MTFFDRRPSARWGVTILAAVLLTAGASGIGALSANAGDKLAPRTASQLLVDVQQAKVSGLSGTIVQNADLGLPSLPGFGSTGSSDMTSLVSGSHTLRLWYAGPNRVRLSLLGQLGESDVIHNGGDLWTWSSKDKTASHRTIPTTSKDNTPSLESTAPTSPQQAAEEALKAIDPSTKVSTIGNSTVAGRSAYELLLQPRDSTSLVGSVRIAIDGKTHLPTRVQVFAKNADKPSFEIAFTSFDPTTPSASVFAFNPPPGTKVTEQKGTPDMLKGPEATAPKSSLEKHSAQADSGGPKIVGSGWSSVVVTKASLPGGSDASGGGSLTRVLRDLPKVSGSWGSGHLLQGTLFSALLTDDGRLAVGAVAPEALHAALGS
ncbi:MAG: Outer rane lipoproteinsorting protein [Marmoricola sp.]|jgi:outer membrane lipoprotein-sorting protein|nr:Outer rane lipoproteinsorting protein [Marmoricola sp.]